MSGTLESRVRDLVRGSGTPEVGLGFRDFANGYRFLVDGGRVFHAASMMKVAVMCEAYRQDAEGAIGLDTPVQLRNSFASIVDGSTYRLNPEDDSEKSLYERIGETESIRQLIELMVTQSSNLATNIVVELLSADRITRFMNELGAAGMTVLRGVEDGKAFAAGLNNTVTAEAYLVLTEALAAGRVVSHPASREMIGVMLRQRHNEAIPAGLPSGTLVAHKTGWNGDYYHDGGLVLSNGQPTMALAVFTKGAVSMEAAHKLVASIAEECWKGLGK